MPTFPNYPSGQPAAQVLFQYADPAQCPSNFISIANVMVGPKTTFKIREVETTAHPTVQTSSATVPATWVPTIREYAATFDISLKTDTDNYAELVRFAQQSTFLQFRIIEADSRLTTILFAGYFTQFDLDNPVNGIVKATCAIRISGDIEFGY
jgi:hypothetical protein